MNEFRRDELTGRQVLLAENRAGRPHQLIEPGLDDGPRDAACPFCPGSEAMTPEAVYEDRGDDGAWRVRVVPNKYPAVASEQGGHEVIVESPAHAALTGQLDPEQMGRVLLAYAARLRSWADDGRFPYRLIFKNVGASAGASLEHLHSQLVALPTIPPLIAGPLAAAGRAGACPWCARVREEAAGSRLVAQREGLVAWCPQASRGPFEAVIAPADHQPRFESIADHAERIGPLARLLLDLFRAIEAETSGAGYNMMLRTTPDGAGQGVGHWRIEILPRTASFAGLELATGLFVNTLDPARAAERLRNRMSV